MQRKFYIGAHLRSRPLNDYSEIFFKLLIYLYEVVRTNFSAEFWTFCNFRLQFGEYCGAT